MIALRNLFGGFPAERHVSVGFAELVEVYQGAYGSTYRPFAFQGQGGRWVALIQTGGYTLRVPVTSAHLRAYARTLYGAKVRKAYILEESDVYLGHDQDRRVSLVLTARIRVGRRA